jgi:hypothetical protein
MTSTTEYPTETHIYALEMLSNGLSDAYPSDCVYNLIGYYRVVLDVPEDWRDVDSVRDVVDIVYDIGIEWATMPRKVTDFKEIAFLTCSCTEEELQEENGWHQYGMEIADSSKDMSPPGLYLLQLALQGPQDLHTWTQSYWSTERLPKVENVHKRKRWPRSIKSLLPHGPENTIRSLIFLLRIDVQSDILIAVMFSLAVCIGICHPCILPYLVRSHTLLELGIVDSIESIGSRITQLTNEKSEEEKPWIMLLNKLTLIGQIVHDLYMHYMDDRQHLLFLGRHHEFYVACGRAMEICIGLDGASIPETCREYAQRQAKECAYLFRSIGGMIYSRFEETRSVEIYPKAKEIFVFQAFTLTQSPDMHVWARFLRTFYRLAMRRRCSAPGCIDTPLEGCLKFCTGCMRVPYCSRACQRRAWTHEEIAHRSICRQVRLLCLRFKLPRSGKAFLKIIEQEHKALPADCSWVPIAEDIEIHFLNITRFEIPTPRKVIPTLRHLLLTLLCSLSTRDRMV